MKQTPTKNKDCCKAHAIPLPVPDFAVPKISSYQLVAIKINT